MTDKAQNYCSTWTYRSMHISLSRKNDYLASACYLCRLYGSCWEHPQRGTGDDDGNGRRGGRAQAA